MFRILNILLAILVFSTTAFAGVELDGTDDYLTISDPISISSSFMSASAWVYFATNTDDDYIMAQNVATNTGFLFFRDDVDSVSGRTDCFTVVIDSSTDYRISSASNSAPSGQWIHVAFTFSGSSAGTDNLRLYINGVEDANSPVTSGVGFQGNSTNALIVGAITSAAGSNANGKIAEIAIWYGTDSDSVLSDHQIQQLAKSRVRDMPLQINPHRLLLYIPFADHPDGGSGNNAVYRDRSGNGNSATGKYGANTTGMTSKAEEVLSYA